MEMKATVNDDCIACGICIDICPDVFQMGDQYAEVQMDPIPVTDESDVKEAADQCPTNAIEIG